MGADNWRECPACIKSAEAAIEARFAQVTAAYGQDSPEGYRKQFAQAESYASEARREAHDEHMREDYEFYLNDDGVFTANYSARCTTCGAEFRFNHSQPYTLEAKNDD